MNKQILSEIIFCQKCKLSKNCKSPIPWIWNIDSKILFIKASPSKEDNDTQELFTAKSDKILKKILTNIWLSINKDYYVTSLIKCYNSEYNNINYKKKLSYIKKCEKYLFRQINSIQPKIIIPIWKEPFSYFIPNRDINDNTYKIMRIAWLKWIEFEKWYKPLLLPILSPSLIIYNESKKTELEQELNKLNLLLKL